MEGRVAILSPTIYSVTLKKSGSLRRRRRRRNEKRNLQTEKYEKPEIKDAVAGQAAHWWNEQSWEAWKELDFPGII